MAKLIVKIKLKCDQGAYFMLLLLLCTFIFDEFYI